jgi:phage head maturation protease
MHVVRKIDRLLDVSPVTYPAYEDTLAEARSILDTKPKKENESDLINIIKLKHK